MAKNGRALHKVPSRQRRLAPHGSTSYKLTASEYRCSKKCAIAVGKKDWEGITCSVCMECPHNAVLLLCSSHDNGCRPYMCGTSFRYSNCLNQYKKAHAKVYEDDRLICPLCRGDVKGWTVVEPAREFLNAQKRSCMQENCLFAGSYKALRKHMKTAHPSARPRQVDPAVEQKWRRLEMEREHSDVMSTIRSAIPGAVVLGDYVIEGNQLGFSPTDDGARSDGFDRNLANVFLLLHAFGPSRNGVGRRLRMHERATGHRSRFLSSNLYSSDDDGDGDDDNILAEIEDDGGGDMSLSGRLRRHSQLILGRSGRWHRRRGRDGDRPSDISETM